MSSVISRSVLIQSKRAATYGSACAMIAGCISDGKSVHWTEMVEMRGEKSKNFWAVGPCLAFRLSCQRLDSKCHPKPFNSKWSEMHNARKAEGRGRPSHICSIVCLNSVLPRRSDAGRRNPGHLFCRLSSVCLSQGFAASLGFSLTYGQSNRHQVRRTVEQLCKRN